jgi:uncharacterized protein YecE (DUF72 family)
MNTSLQIGTCGFAQPKGQYAQHFSCVEVQQTFYQPPQLATLERWRKQVPPSFEFTLKAWQLITHSSQSPTYKRLTKKLTALEGREVGYFRPTELVDEAWQYTLACAQTLQATTILFQCPASFTQTDEHIEHMVRFFSRIDRQGLRLGWEPRGAWEDSVVQALCETLGLWHVVDPFMHQTMTPQHCYYRLHGRQGWRYQYTVDELRDLLELLPKSEVGYVFFNNVHMRTDALVMKKLLEAGDLY